jgi:hypothetical protein
MAALCRGQSAFGRLRLASGDDLTDDAPFDGRGDND